MPARPRPRHVPVPAAEATRWGSDPEFYGPRHLARLQLIVDWLAPRLAAGARVLDVGAGAGRLVNMLALCGFTATGVEPSADFVSYARAHAVPGARFESGEAGQLPVADASVEAVVASEVLEHLADDRAAAKELFRVLVPGGWCLATVPADPARWDASDDWAGHVRRYEDAALAALLRDAGFEVEVLARWGWPVGRLYHRQVFLRALARKQAAPAPSKPPGALKRMALRLLGLGFALDRHFIGHPGGLGLVVLARKPRA